MKSFMIVCLGFALAGCDAMAERQLNDIHKQVVDDALQQYQITKAGGSKMDICVRAGIVAESYLQAKDQANYALWKSTEQADCAMAGITK